MRSLRYLNSILTVLAVLLALNVWTTWMAGPSMTGSARADGIPDAGAQRKEAVDQLKKLNESMENLITMMHSGQVHVRVDSGPDDSKK